MPLGVCAFLFEIGFLASTMTHQRGGIIHFLGELFLASTTAQGKAQWLIGYSASFPKETCSGWYAVLKMYLASNKSPQN